MGSFGENASFTLGYDNIYGQIWIARKKLKNIGHICGSFILKISRLGVILKKTAKIRYFLRTHLLEAALKALNAFGRDPIPLNFFRTFQKSYFQGLKRLINRV